MTHATAPAIYVRLPNWVGDVCMSLPSLDALLATGAPVVVCARPWARDLLAAYPLHGFVPMTASVIKDTRIVRAYRRHHGHKNVRGLVLPDSFSSALVFRVAGIVSAGYRDDGRSPLLRWPLRKPQAPLHAVQSWFYLTRSALRQWQYRAPDDEMPSASLAWQAAPEHEAQAKAALARAGVESGHFVLIAPTAVGQHKGQEKVWSGFNALTRSLQARGITVIAAPPANEQVATRAAAPTAQILAPLSLGAFTALTRHARLVVCNDSGVSHLSAAAQARQLTLFGVTNPADTGPWSPVAHGLGTLGAWPTFEAVQNEVLTLLATPPSTARPALSTMETAPNTASP